MKDTVDSFAQTSGFDPLHRQNIPIDLDLEVTDPLAKHEVTLQFAAFRGLSSGGSCGDRGGHRSAGGGADAWHEGGGEMVPPTPTSLYFTYQFYTCLPTRTERMLLRPDGPKDRLYQVDLLVKLLYMRDLLHSLRPNCWSCLCQYIRSFGAWVNNRSRLLRHPFVSLPPVSLTS